MRNRELLGSHPQEILLRLEGERCSLVRASYGDELVVGFGPSRPARPPLAGETSDWLLFTRLSDWLFRTPDGVLASARERLHEEVLEKLRNALMDKTVSGVTVLDSASSLEIKFDDAYALLLLISTKARHRRRRARFWELRTPYDLIVAADSRAGLVLVGSDTPFGQRSS